MILWVGIIKQGKGKVIPPTEDSRSMMDATQDERASSYLPEAAVVVVAVTVGRSRPAKVE